MTTINLPLIEFNQLSVRRNSRGVLQPHRAHLRSQRKASQGKGLRGFDGNGQQRPQRHHHDQVRRHRRAGFRQIADIPDFLLSNVPVYRAGGRRARPRIFTRVVGLCFRCVMKISNFEIVYF